MKCWHCGEGLIWGGDHDSEDDGYVMDTNLSCPGCESQVMVYLPDNKNKDYMHVLTVEEEQYIKEAAALKIRKAEEEIK